jgi:hypothetical protein
MLRNKMTKGKSAEKGHEAATAKVNCPRRSTHRCRRRKKATTKEKESQSQPLTQCKGNKGLGVLRELLLLFWYGIKAHESTKTTDQASKRLHESSGNIHHPSHRQLNARARPFQLVTDHKACSKARVVVQEHVWWRSEWIHCGPRAGWAVCIEQ